MCCKNACALWFIWPTLLQPCAWWQGVSSLLTPPPCWRRRLSPQVYASHFALPNGMPYVQSNTKPRPGAPHLLGTTPEIEELRPKSPPR